MRSYLRILIPAVVAIVTACQSDTPTSPTRSPVAAALAALSLEDLEAAEKARVDARKEAEQGIYDSLKVEWQRVVDDTTGAYDDMLVCDPLQYVAEVRIVGPEGADINFGPHSLRIPAGALSVPTVITAEAPTSLQVVSRFSPHGTTFQAGVHPTLELSYKHCRGPANRAARIAYIGTGGNIIEWPPSQDVPEDALVRAVIGHFSGYIVAY